MCHYTHYTCITEDDRLPTLLSSTTAALNLPPAILIDLDDVSIFLQNLIHFTELVRKEAIGSEPTQVPSLAEDTEDSVLATRIHRAG